MGFPDADESGVSPDNYFESEYAKEELAAPSEKFSAAQFHFHAKSEHTIMGKRYDLEMHTVHLAQAGEDGRRRLEPGDGSIWASALGLIFDRKNYDPTVTNEEK